MFLFNNEEIDEFMAKLNNINFSKWHKIYERKGYLVFDGQKWKVT